MKSTQTLDGKTVELRLHSGVVKFARNDTTPNTTGGGYNGSTHIRTTTERSQKIIFEDYKSGLDVELNFDEDVVSCREGNVLSVVFGQTEKTGEKVISVYNHNTGKNIRFNDVFATLANATVSRGKYWPWFVASTVVAWLVMVWGLPEIPLWSLLVAPLIGFIVLSVRVYPVASKNRKVLESGSETTALFNEIERRSQELMTPDAKTAAS